MKSFKNKSAIKNNDFNQDIRLGVFAEPSARKSYNRLFEIAKLNFQALDASKQFGEIIFS